MRLLDLSYDEPERNLALDEALLNEAEAGRSPETLRFWESPVTFVVLGIAQRFEDEVLAEACARDGVPVRRRCSAGGCVLQMPGCINYSLVLSQDAREELSGIRRSYEYILGTVASALHEAGAEVVPDGISDLRSGVRKVSGNAQRRRKRFLLHHGTLLYDADASLMANYLREPAARPEYRGGRIHSEFVSNLGISREDLLKAIADAFSGEAKQGDLTQAEHEETSRLANEKYATKAWTRRR